MRAGWKVNMAFIENEELDSEEFDSITDDGAANVAPVAGSRRGA